MRDVNSVEVECTSVRILFNFIGFFFEGASLGSELSDLANTFKLFFLNILCLID